MGERVISKRVEPGDFSGLFGLLSESSKCSQRIVSQGDIAGPA
jgi:hypothetical protein